MKLKRYLYVLLSLLYFELIFNLFTYDSYLRSSVMNIVLFTLVNSVIVFLITSSWSDKVNRVMTYIVYSILPFWYGLYYVFYNLLLTPFSVALLRQTDQAMAFPGNVIMAILENIHVLILLFIPLILFIVFKKKLFFNNSLSIKDMGISFCLLFIFLGIYVVNIFVQERKTGNIYNLYFETNNVSLNIERLGVMAASFLDIERFVFGFDEKIKSVEMLEEVNNQDELFEYDYNKVEIDIDDDSSGVIKTINNYVESEVGTKKNQYTGMFKGKNLVFIVAESFSEVAVSKELTPTLYKLMNEGFHFENYYTSNNLSTIGGEFQALTGLYADNSLLSNWRNGSAYFPYGIGTMFGDEGYNVFGYHNNSAFFQDRNVYLKSQGIDNYKGCYNGLEKDINCEQWPQSDVEMIDATYLDYINSEEPFLAYYITVSGHFHYTYSGNAIARKNKKYVKDLGYNENVSAYLATQIELDRAVEKLINKLDEVNKLDDTVIVLTADHFPYNLDIDDINTLSDYKRDVMIEANSNALIIYNSKMKSVDVSKVAMSIDVLPTVLNLFGMEYDSRLIMGKDILSTYPGIAIFKDKSWVTDKGTYYASSGKFVGEDVDDGYVENVNNIVNNRTAISRMIVANDYYRYLFGK